jgi:hypothetical protein
MLTGVSKKTGAIMWRHGRAHFVVDGETPEWHELTYPDKRNEDAKKKKKLHAVPKMLVFFGNVFEVFGSKTLFYAYQDAEVPEKQ